jgi:sorting nexin-4
MADKVVGNYCTEELGADNGIGHSMILPRDHLLQWMQISVSEPEKRTGNSSVKQDTYIVYLIETKVTDSEMPHYGEAPTSVWRRYSEFELLRCYLEIMYPAIVVPPLPEKRVSHAWQKLPTDRLDMDFIERRRIGLENFLLRVASHSILSKDTLFHGFLKDDSSSWRDAVYATDFQSKADWKLVALSASYRLKRPDRRFDEIKNYSTELQTHINNIIKIRTRICDKLYGMYKIHANYGRVFSEWSAIETDMADGLQSAGHYMDVYSQSIETYLEDEEQFADQLKEYYAFGDALRSVCRKQELTQLDLEKAEDSVMNKSIQREQLLQGRTSMFTLSGMKSKLFGADTPEQRDAKVRQLDEQIKEAEQQVKDATMEAQGLVELALRDIDRFQRQKVKDLKDVFTNYAILQTEKLKKDITLWQNLKDCYSKI